MSRQPTESSVTVCEEGAKTAAAVMGDDLGVIGFDWTRGEYACDTSLV
jgi:hypothetical protein